MPETKTHIPTAAELARWERLTTEEQGLAFRDSLFDGASVHEHVVARLLHQAIFTNQPPGVPEPTTAGINLDMNTRRIRTMFKKFRKKGEGKPTHAECKIISPNGTCRDCMESAEDCLCDEDRHELLAEHEWQHLMGYCLESGPSNVPQT